MGEATWRVTTDGDAVDLDLTSAQRGIVRGAEAVAARCTLALRTRRGDWFADLLAGPDEDLTTGQYAFLGGAEQEYRRVVAAVTGVAAVTVERTGRSGRSAAFRVLVTGDAANGGSSVPVAVA